MGSYGNAREGWLEMTSMIIAASQIILYESSFPLSGDVLLTASHCILGLCGATLETRGHMRELIPRLETASNMAIQASIPS